MNTRREQILSGIVRDYVRSGIPVGSKKLSGPLSLSSATIRNVMLELDRDGYLEQPHTSSGRVPTDRGYRYFVDYLIKERIIEEERIKKVRSTLDCVRYGLSELISGLSKMLSSITDCIAFISVGEEDQSEIVRLEFVRVSSHGLLIVLVLGNGRVESKMNNVPGELDDATLSRIARAVNSRLSGIRVSDVSETILDSIFMDIRGREEHLHSAVRTFFSDIIESLGRRLYIEGSLRLIHHPEFQDARKLQPVFEVLEYAGKDGAIFTLESASRKTSVSIGSENGIEELRECSVIKRNFQFGDRTVGTIGILGPRRMEYPEFLSLLEFVSDSLSRELERLPFHR